MAIAAETASAAAMSASNDLAFEAIIEHTDLASSYAISAREAAWRGERAELRYYLTRMRLTTIDALRAFNQLDSAPRSDLEAP